MGDEFESDCRINEAQGMRERYQRFHAERRQSLYSFERPDFLLLAQEKERAFVRWIRSSAIAPVSTRRVLEVGCGTGRNLLDLLRLGFEPENLVGCELLDSHAEVARRRLPTAVHLIVGDAAELPSDLGLFDVVLQSTVFSSILDAGVQDRLAHRMWELVRPGGGVLWYDFIYCNPINPDVRGVPIRRIRELFPSGALRVWRVTLAPPLGRRVARIGAVPYHALNAIPFLRTHVLCWIVKGGQATQPIGE